MKADLGVDWGKERGLTSNCTSREGRRSEEKNQGAEIRKMDVWKLKNVLRRKDIEVRTVERYSWRKFLAFFPLGGSRYMNGQVKQTENQDVMKRLPNTTNCQKAYIPYKVRNQKGSKANLPLLPLKPSRPTPADAAHYAYLVSQHLRKFLYV